MILDTQSHCIIEYLPELHCVLQTWKGFAVSEKFRQSIRKTIEFFQTNTLASSIISDTTQQDAVKPQDAEWVATYATPILVKHGLRKLAFVAPKSVVTKMAEEHFARKAGEELEIRWFSDVAAAKTWISQK